MARDPWSRREVRRVVLAFVDGTAGKWDWDGFMCARLDDPDLEALQSFGSELPTQFPPDEPGWYASAAGLKELRLAAERLRVDDADLADGLARPVTRTPNRARARILLASSLALLLAVLAGVGAPSSDFAPKDSVWWTFDPLMWPALFGGVVVAVIALVASIAVGVRTAAVLCLLASTLTAIGIVIAGGTSDHSALTFYAVHVAVAGIPAVVALNVLTRSEPR